MAGGLTDEPRLYEDQNGNGPNGSQQRMRVVVKDGTISIVDTDTTPDIANESIALANTEQSYVLPSNTKKFLIRNRAKNDLKFAYTATGTTSDWLTIKKGAVFTDDSFYSSQTIYFQGPSAGDIVEIITYV